MAATNNYLYPTWDYDNTGKKTEEEDDAKIWQKLVDYVQSKNDGDNKDTAKPLLLDFLEHEMQKNNFISINRYIEQNPNGMRQENVNSEVTRGTRNIAAKAVAPFVVPRDKNDNYAVNDKAYYNFNVRGRTFNGKVIRGGNSNTVTFDKSTVTMLIGTGNYQRMVDNCSVVDLKDRNGVSPFTKDAQRNIQISRTDIDIVQNEILRPYFKFMRFVDEAFNLPADCHSDDRMVLLLENLGRLFVDSKLDITGHPWRRVQMAAEEPDGTAKEKRREEEERLKRAKEEEEKKEKERKKKTQEPYDLKDIDRERIALDALLWTKREFGNQFKRTDPSVYDLFEALEIPKNFTLEKALRELIRRLNERKDPNKAHDWEPSIYTFYGNKVRRTRTDMWESALVHCLQGTTPEAYTRAIVDHIFLNPSIQDAGNRYSDANLFQTGRRHDFKSNGFESFDQELAQNYATHLRASQDSNKYLMILNLPWPETKRHLRKQPERNRYYPEAYVEARYPEVFYVNLKREHEACHRLRKTAYALSLSREKGYPVISRRQVVAPDAFHTDYRTLPLPRIVSSDPSTGVYNGPSPAVTAPKDKRDYWSGHNPSLAHEYGREAHRSQATPELFVEPTKRHPLYPSRTKANF